MYDNLAELHTKDENIPLPNNEQQLRPLSKFPKLMQQGIWSKAVETANGKTLTGIEIKQIAEKLNTTGKEVFRKIASHVQAEKTNARKKARLEALENESRNYKPLNKSLGKFSVILADPPWQYEHAVTENRAIENHYGTMTTEEIAQLQVKDICTRSAVLYIWVTSPKLQEGLYVMGEWGFSYRSSMVWVKDQVGMGYWARSRHEFLLIGTRGKMPCPDPKMRPESVIYAKRSKHSEKPDDVHRIIEKTYPTLMKIDLFARKKRNKWKVWSCR